MLTDSQLQVVEIPGPMNSLILL